MPQGNSSANGWVGRQDVEDYIADAYWRTAERIAAGELKDDENPGDQDE
jgi:hypothetical protein